MKMTRTLCFGVAAVLVGSGMAEAGPGDTLACSTATLTGAYGYLRQGHTTAGTFITAVGLATFDGQGSVTAEEAISTNGVISHATVENGYTVNSDCSATILDATGARTRSLAIAHAGEEVLGISAVSGVVEKIQYERVAGRHGAEDVWRQDAGAGDRPVCTLATFAGTYGFERNGHIPPTGDLVASGILFSDGQGTQSAHQTVSRSGTISDPAVQPATYTVEPDCRGTAIDPTGRVFVEFVVVHGGSEVLGVGESGNNVAIKYERIFRPCGPDAAGCRDN